jgi:hypothetical protein
MAIVTSSTTLRWVSSITQTGATWTCIGRTTDQEYNYTEIWAAFNVSNAGTTITVHLSGAPSGGAGSGSVADVAQYSGISSADQTAGAVGESGSSPPTSVTGTTPTTVQNSELFIGAVGLGDPAGESQSNPTNGFTLFDGVADSNTFSLAYLQKIVASEGQASSGTTFPAYELNEYTSEIATFKGPTQANVLKGYKFQFTGTTGSPVQSLSTFFHSGAAGLFRMALYTDNGGNPSTPASLLWACGDQTIQANTVNTVPIGSGTSYNSWGGTLTNGAWYWLMWECNNTATSLPSLTTGTANYGIQLAQTYGAWPSSWSGGTNDAEEWTQYLTYVASTSSATVAASTFHSPTSIAYSLLLQATTISNGGTATARYAPTSALDLSIPDFLSFWAYFADFNTTNLTFTVKLWQTSGGNWASWSIDPSNIPPNQWVRISVPLRNPNATSSTGPTMTSIAVIDFLVTSSAAAQTCSIYIDDIDTDLGTWAILEEQVTDDMHGLAPSGVFCWDGPNATFDTSFGIYFDAVGAPVTSFLSTNCETLSGVNTNVLQSIFGSGKHTLASYSLPPSSQGIPPAGFYGTGATDMVTPYTSMMFGTQKRVLVGFKLPPGTNSISVASPTLTNFRAQNKMLLKLLMEYASEPTTMLG